MGRKSILLIGLSLSAVAVPVHAAGTATAQSSIAATQPYITQGVEVQRGSTWYLGTHADPNILRARINKTGVRYEQLQFKNTSDPQGLRGLVAQATKLNHKLADIHQHDVKLEQEITSIRKQLPPLPSATCTTFYYRVLNGDSLALIAKHVLKNPRDWKLLYNTNKAAVGGNPDTLDVGTVLKVPTKAN